jgi:iron complex outermembrane receptor protein
LGLRYDDYADFESALSPRAALLWEVKKDLMLKFLYGRAFRSPPSLSELYESANLPLLDTSNSELHLESLHSYEIGADYRINDSLNFKGNIFYYQRQDVIRRLENRVENAGEYRGHGLELEVDWKATPKLFFTANYAWQKVEDKLLNANTHNAPHHQIYLRNHWLFKPEWSLDTQFNWVMDRERLIDEQGRVPPIADYYLLDLTLRYKPIKEHWNVALGVRNVFDKQAFEPVPSGWDVAPYDLPLAGRNFFFELRSTF